MNLGKPSTLAKHLGQWGLTLTILFFLPLISFGETGGHKILALEFSANTEGEVRTVVDPNTGENLVTDALCFDGEIIDIASGKVVGEATDCLSPQEFDDGGTQFNVVDDSIGLIGTTIFHLHGGQIISQGDTSVRPVIWENQPNTHITGAIPQPDSNSILAGTGKFKNSSGTVRLSGAVDMSGFTAETGEGPIAFTCLFVITLD